MGVRAVEKITASVIVYLWSGCGNRFAALEGDSALLRVPHQMIGGVAELDIDGAYSLEIVADVQLIAHAHTAMQLDGLLRDKACGIAHLRLGAGRQFRTIRFTRFQA